MDTLDAIGERGTQEVIAQSHMNRICRKLSLPLTIALIGFGEPAAMACDDCIEVKVEDSDLLVETGYADPLPSVNVDLKHNGQTSPFTEENREEYPYFRHIFFKDFEFKLKPPDEKAQKSKAIELDIQSSGGGPHAREEFGTTLKFVSCYRKFEIKTTYGTKQVGLGEGVEDSAEFSNPNDEDSPFVSAGVSEKEDSNGEKWIYLEIASVAGGTCSWEGSNFVAPDVTVYVMLGDKPGQPGDGKP